MEKKTRFVNKSMPVEPVTDEEMKSILAILESTNSKSLFPKKVAVAKKIAKDIQLGMGDGRIPEDFFSRRR